MSTRTRYLSEPAAWQRIARRILAGQAYYLCFGVDDLWVHDKISPETAASMRRRIRAHLAPCQRTYLNSVVDFTEPWPRRTEVQSMKSLAALFLALEAADDDNQR